MKSKLPEFAKMAPAICHAPGLFVSRDKNAPEQLMKLNYVVGPLLYRFVGPQLGPVELRVLQGLVALSAMQNFGEETGARDESLDEVQALLSRSAQVRTSYNQLAQAIGYQADSGSAHAGIRKALEQLFAVAVFISRADELGAKDMAAGHLLTRLQSSEARNAIDVALCPILAAAALGGRGEYLRINLDEVRRLKSDPARLLHRRLHYINAGQKPRNVRLDTLAGYIWPVEANASTHRKRRERVGKAVSELEYRLGWTVKKTADGYLIGRPA